MQRVVNLIFILLIFRFVFHLSSFVHLWLLNLFPLGQFSMWDVALVYSFILILSIPDLTNHLE